MRRQSTEAEIHGPYLEALLSLRTSEHVAYAVKAFCELLGWSRGPIHKRLSAVFWHIVLKPDSELSTQSKGALLHALAKRLRRQTTHVTQTDGKDKTVLESFAAGQHVLHRSPSICRGTGDSLSITGLTDILAAAIFHAVPAVPVYNWALSLGLATFATERPLAERWNSLVLLALCHTIPETSTSSPAAIVNEQDQVGSQLSEWDTVCILASVQASFGHIENSRFSSMSLQQSIHSLAKHAWVTQHVNAKQPTFVGRAIATAFFRLAGIVKDTVLAATVAEHCISGELWTTPQSDEVMEVAYLATEYAWTSIVCETRSVQVLYEELEEMLHTPHLPIVIGHVIRNIGRRDPQPAFEFFTLAQKNSICLSSDVHQSLALSLASYGLVNVALPFLQHSSITHDQTQRLLNAILLALAQQQDSILHPDVAAAVADAMHTSYQVTIPPRKHRALVQHTLMTLISSNCGIRATSIFEMIHQASSNFFSAAFSLQFARSLLNRRQFQPVARMITGNSTTQTPAKSALRRAGLLGFFRQGSNALAMRIFRSTSSHRDRSVLIRITRAVKFRSNSPSSTLTLTISSAIGRVVAHGPAAQIVMQVLVQAGRMRFARELFLRTRDHLSPSVRTSLGNTILDAYAGGLSKRNGHLKRVFSAYNFMDQKCGFIPDYVTFNTLIKAFLRGSMDSENMKALFDHLIKHMYLRGEVLRRNRVLFGTSASFIRPFHLPRVTNRSNSFEQQTRPLLKMFIKAFHTRGDAAAARKLIGLLKSEELAVMRKRDTRRRRKKVGRKWI